MIRVLLAEDEDLIRTGLRLVLDSSADITVVAEARNGSEALEGVREHRPDVVVMDIQMPGMDGLTATRHLTALPDAPAVLLLTTFDRDAHIHAAVQAGASGFLLKDAHHTELLAAVRAVHQGDAMLSPSVARRVMQLANTAIPATREAATARLAQLSEAEREVLALVGSGLSNSAIADRLGLNEPTVKRRVSRLLAALDCENRVQLAIAAIDAGIAPRA
ncbi:response regulator transcription factor [Streptomyces sp. NA04227]|uniref:response regulator transcription factor n=1 Tax=Streptomyces sp. NA04227 TaxID=2742136 RepID=UPI0015906C6F|nr:response regulator transcription factor [Streptomyces sp. NA04227]QKW08798.1 response regulator transcription factor [Streptomyces sp. NA04227]